MNLSADEAARIKSKLDLAWRESLSCMSGAANRAVINDLLAEVMEFLTVCEQSLPEERYTLTRERLTK